MHRHVTTVLVMLCYFSYYTLLDLWYKSQAEKTTTAKGLGAKEGISMREAEQQLDADIFLDEFPKWGLQSLQRPFILHQMFCHTTTNSRREHDRAIHWGQRQPPQTGSEGRSPCHGSCLTWDALSGYKNHLQ